MSGALRLSRAARPSRAQAACARARQEPCRSALISRRRNLGAFPLGVSSGFVALAQAKSMLAAARCRSMQPHTREEGHRVRALAQERSDPKARNRFVRFLRACFKALRSWLRAAELLILWAPVCVSGAVVAYVVRFPLWPAWASKALLESWLEIVLRVIEASGPTFIKAAQWASTRRDLFPENVCRVLGRLHTFTRRRPRGYGEDALDAAFGPSWRHTFKLEEDALGSGCVAQVYKGHVIAGEHAGETVAIKVVEPRLKEKVLRDLNLMRGVTSLLELVPRVHWLSLTETVDEFGDLMEAQLDLRREAMNLERFARDFKEDDSLVFPRPLRPWVMQSVLVEEFKEGQPISEFFRGKETKLLARMSLHAFLQMVFINNFVHGDLHPGNMMVGRREDTGRPRLVMLDGGIVCELDKHDRKNFIDLFHAIVVGDGVRAGRLMIERARNQRCTDPEGFCREVDTLVQTARSSGLRLGQIQAGELLSRMLALCLEHEVKLESKFASMVVAIAVLEGVGRSLDPDLNIMRAALPVVTRASMTI